MSKSDLTINPTGNARGRMTGRNLLLVMLAAMVTMVAFVSLPSVANANVGLGASSGNRSGDLATPVDFGSTAQANLPKQVTIWLYNDNNTFLNAQSSTNVFTITGSGFDPNAADPFFVKNLENVQGIDSSGLSAFVAGQTYLTRQKGQLKLAAARPAIRKLLKATLLDQLLAVFDSVDEAMRSFPAR